MKKLLTIFLLAGIWSSLQAQNCTFTDNDTLLLHWDARPDSENVDQYIIYSTQKTETGYTDMSYATCDIWKLFTCFDDTVTFRVTAKNEVGESEFSDLATAFYIPPGLPSDIPLYETASEIWSGKGTIWKGFGGCWYHLEVETTNILDIAFWTSRLGDYPDSTFIWRDVDFSKTGLYRFDLTLYKWNEAECYVSIDGQDFKAEDSVIIEVEAGMHQVMIKSKVSPMYLYDISIMPESLRKPGKVINVGISKK